jgi:hypothetical protein
METGFLQIKEKSMKEKTKMTMIRTPPKYYPNEGHTTRREMCERAREAGRRAAHKGLAIRHCPFMQGTLFSLEWKDSFLECAEKPAPGKKIGLKKYLKILKKGLKWTKAPQLGE